MNSKAIAITILALVGLLAAACGADTPTPTPAGPAATSSPTPSGSLAARCISTEAYALEHLVAVIGEDRFPTAFDAINVGGCDFTGEVSGLEIVLDGPGGTHTAFIDLAAPVLNMGMPLGDDAIVPTLDASFAPGRYERTVTAIATDGRRVEVAGFEPVILVREADSIQALLLRAQSRWERSGITAYTYTAAWQCFCPQDWVASVVLDVRDGVVQGVAFADGRAAEVPDPERFGTVENLFATIQDAIDGDAASITVEYEPQSGYPTTAFIDYAAFTIDEEQGFTVSELTSR